MIERILTEGIYYYQEDARIVGEFSMDSYGNINKHNYKVGFKEKFNFLMFNKNVRNPISTTYVKFIISQNKLFVFSGNMNGDAITVAKSLKNRRDSAFNKLEIHSNFIRIFYPNMYQEMFFDLEGNNTESKFINELDGSILLSNRFSYLNWENL